MLMATLCTKQQSCDEQVLTMLTIYIRYSPFMHSVLSAIEEKNKMDI